MQESGEDLTPENRDGLTAQANAIPVQLHLQKSAPFRELARDEPILLQTAAPEKREAAVG